MIWGGHQSGLDQLEADFNPRGNVHTVVRVGHGTVALLIGASGCRSPQPLWPAPARHPPDQTIPMGVLRRADSATGSPIDRPSGLAHSSSSVLRPLAFKRCIVVENVGVRRFDAQLQQSPFNAFSAACEAK